MKKYQKNRVSPLCVVIVVGLIQSKLTSVFFSLTEKSLSFHGALLTSQVSGTNIQLAIQANEGVVLLV